MTLVPTSIRILLGVTGSVASVKVPILVDLFQQRENVAIELKVVATGASLHFFEPKQTKVPVYLEHDEHVAWKAIGDNVLHIQLRNWADLLLIAPLSANTLAKMAHGLCDNLLTCVLRAWDFHKPCIVAPAMNTAMYLHPITSTQLDTVRAWGVHVIPPITKKLACGDTGIGAMAEPSDIVAATLAHFLTRHSSPNAAPRASPVRDREPSAEGSTPTRAHRDAVGSPKTETFAGQSVGGWRKS